ncbi:YHYH domain-containing protein [Pseudomonas sp. A-B-26]|nr:YHYH domain-containing protein [Pseudomonas sp. A-B-26]
MIGRERPIAACRSSQKLIAQAFVHRGGTDSKGCHRDHKTNDYHCH